MGKSISIKKSTVQNAAIEGDTYRDSVATEAIKRHANGGSIVKANVLDTHRSFALTIYSVKYAGTTTD
ncbi:unnamed protein product [Phytophthora fragariaefolia]|uniref:Unnamed protein product n=1 Tax=Phytophthora fragariaefolia TaxID=1490495 RepID=A0A9W6X696_9STRA|nr:unnamed protein product [Phytophthora fragariaefolia]